MLPIRIFAFCLAVALTSCSEPSGHPEAQSSSDIHSLYLAARKLDAAIMVGAPFAQYSEILTSAAAQLLITEDSPRPDAKQRDIISQYATVLEKYRDVLDVWSLAIQGGKGDEPKLIAIQKQFAIHPRPGSENLFEDIRNQLWEQCASDVSHILPKLRAAGVI